MTTARERLDAWFEEADKLLNDDATVPQGMRWCPDPPKPSPLDVVTYEGWCGWPSAG